MIKPGADLSADLADAVNPNSVEILRESVVEPSLGAAPPGARYQFERHGYFCVDADARPGRPVFNRTVTLRDTWAKVRAGAKDRPETTRPQSSN